MDRAHAGLTPGDPVPVARPAPIGASARAASIDVVRGVALLGILAVNIVMFAWPYEAYTKPAPMLAHDASGAPSTLATVSWGAMNVFFYQKMVFLFSMLFGAGVVFYARKFDEGPLSRGAGLWYRRMVWLLAIGLAHAFLLWYGDILVWYAVIGASFVWWVRRWRPAALLALGIPLIVLGLGMLTGMSALQASFAPEEGQPNPVSFDAELAAYTGSYLDMLKHRAFMLLFMYILMLPLMMGPYVGGVMLVGQAMMKWGWLTGKRRPRDYFVLAAIALPIGWGLAIFATLELLAAPEGSIPWRAASVLMFSGPPGGIGTMALIVGLWKIGALGSAAHALAAVGRMAFTNYLLQTVLCTTFFYSYGLGFYGRVTYPSLWLVVVGVWAINIILSLVWLRFFRFGPAEWLWRSLTYMRLQPMRRPDSPA